MRKRALPILIVSGAIALAILLSSVLGLGPLSGVSSRPSDRVVRPADIPTCGPGWRPIPAPQASRVYNELHAVTAVAPDDVWAAGIYGGEEFALTLVQNYTGEWVEAPSPSVSGFSNHLYSIDALSKRDMWIVGASHQGTGLWRTLALRYIGGEWRIVPTPNTSPINSLNAVALLSQDLAWAVGEQAFLSQEGSTRPLALRWNGSAWEIVDTGITAYNSTLNAIAAISKDDIWVGGSFTDREAQQLRPLLAHWDGTAWQTMTIEGGGQVWDMHAISSNDIWAVGNFGPLTMALHWDGAAWSRVPTPTPGDGKGNATLNAVTSLPSRDVWAVGSYGNGGKDRALALRWRDGRWEQMPAPSLGDFSDVLYDVAEMPGRDEMWAVGSTIADELGNNLPLILRYSDVRCDGR